MHTQICAECGKLAEPPFTIMTWKVPEELRQIAEEQGHPLERKSVLCRDCTDHWADDEELAKELEGDIRSGTICSSCLEKLEPPGGTTLWSHDRKKLLRLCPKCKEGVERFRQARGKE
jgi:hypothetical protein